MCEKSEQKADVNVGSNALLACPFCGGEPCGPYQNDYGNWIIECCHGVVTIDHNSKENVVSVWNKRAS